ncbi:MAG TPA: EboA domain-containing protein, partial [Kofleriaceae bacterium]
DLLRRGEVRERQAVLRVLAALPAPARFVELAIDACRTNVETVFAAIACDNDFPARHFPAPAFHHMVLKALFIGAPLARVAGLAERTSDELVRMVDAYVSERAAAGRAIPADVALIRRPT